MGPSPKITLHLRGGNDPQQLHYKNEEHLKTSTDSKLTFSFSTSFSDTEELQALF